MKIISRKDGDDWVYFDCPGCEIQHGVPVQGSKAWGFNGDLERPTLTPSLLVRGRIRCHHFVKDGKIKFLSDCDHGLAGQTVDMTEIE